MPPNMPPLVSLSRSNKSQSLFLVVTRIVWRACPAMGMGAVSEFGPVTFTALTSKVIISSSPMLPK